ncbi:hypothetical protein D9757_008391 [Collybiopsis confluens]|uniref:Uncharacterized protein n=1 Tax=Collybiopsis confluens TaxID=2823264 RepID=A0A8H5HI47_9AGAR|nr:hypothetical protein D9757_008391 [Collybiopsis confluens]
MAPYYGPDEPEATIQVERFFIAGDVTVGIGYGIQLALYYSCAMYLWSRRKQSRKALFLLAFISLQLSVWTIFVIVQARTIQLMYVDNRNYPGGPWSYFLATQNLAVDVMFDATLFIMTFLSDSLMLWRCWVIWTSSGTLIASLVIAFPAVILLASFVMGTLWTLESTHPGLSFYSKLPLAFGTSYYSISLGVNIVLTILITIRLLVYRRQMLDSLPPEHAKHYLSLLTIMVESAAIYSMFALLFLITYAINNPANQILLAFSKPSNKAMRHARAATASRSYLTSMQRLCFSALSVAGTRQKRTTSTTAPGENIQAKTLAASQDSGNFGLGLGIQILTQLVLDKVVQSNSWELLSGDETGAAGKGFWVRGEVLLGQTRPGIYALYAPQEPLFPSPGPSLHTLTARPCSRPLSITSSSSATSPGHPPLASTTLPSPAPNPHHALRNLTLTPRWPVLNRDAVTTSPRTKTNDRVSDEIRFTIQNDERISYAMATKFRSWKGIQRLVQEPLSHFDSALAIDWVKLSLGSGLIAGYPRSKGRLNAELEEITELLSMYAEENATPTVRQSYPGASA